MIVRPRPRSLAILFTLRGSVLPVVMPKVIGITAIACLVVAAERRWPGYFPQEVGTGPFTLIGLALSIFLSFRNGACYDRWWEGRKAWGQLIVEIRGTARLLATTLPDPDFTTERNRALRRLAGFAHALHAVLRGQNPTAAATPWLPSEDVAKLAGKVSVPDAVLVGLGTDIARWYRAGTISDVLLEVFERKMTAIALVQTICERIRFTPLPFAYTLLLYRTAWVYCLMLPFGLASSLGWATPLATTLVAYTFFGLDALGDELEEPFGLEPNDLPLDALLHLVDAAVLEALGEPVPPPPGLDGVALH